jgi:hypothetical protein
MQKLVNYIAARPVLAVGTILMVGAMQAGLLITAMVIYSGGL